MSKNIRKLSELIVLCIAMLMLMHVPKAQAYSYKTSAQAWYFSGSSDSITIGRTNTTNGNSVSLSDFRGIYCINHKEELYDDYKNTYYPYQKFTIKGNNVTSLTDFTNNNTTKYSVYSADSVAKLAWILCAPYSTDNTDDTWYGWGYLRI